VDTSKQLGQHKRAAGKSGDTNNIRKATRGKLATAKAARSIMAYSTYI
jgi:hypothetical protein